MAASARDRWGCGCFTLGGVWVSMLCDVIPFLFFFLIFLQFLFSVSVLWGVKKKKIKEKWDQIIGSPPFCVNTLAAKWKCRKLLPVFFFSVFSFPYSLLFFKIKGSPTAVCVVSVCVLSFQQPVLPSPTRFLFLERWASFWSSHPPSSCNITWEMGNYSSSYTIAYTFEW